MRIHRRPYYLIVFLITFFMSPFVVSCNESYSQKTMNLENRNNIKCQFSEQDASLINTFPFEELNVSERSGLLYIREEEKLARDVYVLLCEQYALPVFKNISKSEQRHMDAVHNLLDKYSLEDPAEDVPGKFINAHLQELYDQLIIKGSGGRIDALLVGALIEETDILDIQTELDQSVDNQDIKFVYSNLLRGSKNHLKAFTKWIHSYDITYEPVLLTPAQVDDIVGDP